MKYYTIQNGSILIANNISALSKHYDNVKDLPEDYEVGKYIVQDDKLVRNENYEAEQAQAEAERIQKLKLTKREVFLCLYESNGMTPEQIKTLINDPIALIEFEYANEYYRGNPLIDFVGGALGYSKSDLDYLFMHKKFPPKDVLLGGEVNA